MTATHAIVSVQIPWRSCRTSSGNRLRIDKLLDLVLRTLLITKKKKINNLTENNDCCKMSLLA